MGKADERWMDLRSFLDTAAGRVACYDLNRLADVVEVEVELDLVPFSIRVLLENLARHAGVLDIPRSTFQAVVAAAKGEGPPREIPFMPARILMQDFTGVPAVVDTAAMRDAVKDLSTDPGRINPQVPVDAGVDPGNCFSLEGGISAYTGEILMEIPRVELLVENMPWHRVMEKAMPTVMRNEHIFDRVHYFLLVLKSLSKCSSSGFSIDAKCFSQTTMSQ